MFAFYLNACVSSLHKPYHEFSIPNTYILEMGTAMRNMLTVGRVICIWFYM